MSPTRPATTVPALLCLLAAPLLAACGGSDAGSGGRSVDVEASDDACKVAQTQLAPGRVTFDVTNKGSKVTEVYVYGEKNGSFSKIVSEVENIGPGTSRDMSVKLGSGTYEVACKPGQKGQGIRTKITVTGDEAGATGSEAAYDREIEMSVGAAGLAGLEGATAKKGEKIEFKLSNTTDGERELYVLDPDGKKASEVEIAAGKTGETVVELAKPGTWTIKVEGGAADIEKALPVS